MPLNVDVMVFDSGVGGLSILEAVRAEHPGLSYAFVGDNAGLPYGDKPESWLVDRVPHVIEKALDRVECKLLIVACNTASTIVLPPLRERFSFPVIGVVPAIKPAAAMSRSKVIGLLATPATVKRPYTDELIREFASDCAVVKVGSSRLVAIAEEKLRGKKPDLGELKDILRDFTAENLDVVVLGCTHFPLLRAEIASLFPAIQWVDSGKAIASRVAHFNLQPGPGTGQGVAMFTAPDIALQDVKGFGFTALEFFPVGKI